MNEDDKISIAGVLLSLIFMRDIFSAHVWWGMFNFYYPPLCMIYGLNKVNI